MIENPTGLLLDTRLGFAAWRNPKPDPVFPSVSKLTYLKTKKVCCFDAKVNSSSLGTVQSETHLVKPIFHETNEQSRVLSGDDEHIIAVANQLPIRAGRLRKPSHSPIPIQHVQKHIG